MDVDAARLRRAGPVAAVALAVCLSAVPPAAEAAAPRPTGVRAYLSTAAGIVPLDLATRTTGPTIALPSTDIRMAISPDGRTAWVLGREEGWLRRVSLVTGAVGPAIPLGGAGSAVALTPDGRTAWVSLARRRLLVPVDTATSAAGTPVRVPVDGVSGPEDLAITPDGRTALVAGGCDAGTVDLLDLRTGASRGAVHLPADRGYPCASDVAVAPDGRTAYAGDRYSGAGLSPIDLSPLTLLPPVPLDGSATGDIVVTPDGRKVYTAGGVVDVRTRQVVATFPAASGSAYAVQPSGTSLLVAQSDGGVRPLYTATDTLGPVLAAGVQAYAVTFAPGQAPLARFTAADGPARTVRLDARASVGVTSPVARYRWSFGDGRGATTTSPTLSHTYDRPGRYTVRLTVTDTSGTSTTTLYASRQLLRNGGPRATTTRSIVVP